MNRSFQGENRKYANNIPTCLHNRPHKFVAHVMARLNAARDKQNDPSPYTTTSGANPTCNCQDFLRHSYPCKHIIKLWLDNDGQLVLPKSNLDPWIELDCEELDVDELNVSTDASDSEFIAEPPEVILDSPSSPEAKEVILNLPSSAAPDGKEKLVSTLNEIRVLNDKIKNWTYATSSLDAAEAVLDKLQSTFDECKGIVTRDHLPCPPRLSLPTKRKRRLTIRSGALKKRKRCPLKYKHTVGLRRDHMVTTLSECEEDDCLTSNNSPPR